MGLKKYFLLLIMTSFLACNAAPSGNLRDHFLQKQSEELVEQVKILASKTNALALANIAQYIISTAILWRLWHIGKLLERR